MKEKLSLKPETRSGFKVTTERKKLWATQLDLLEKFIAVCEKYNLKYSLCGGSLLGAIRHNGYIPWDDDIDVMMLRDDYEKLCRVADKEFKKPYFFATSFNDTKFIPHAQLKNLNTTAIDHSDDEIEYNKCIFMDIFVFDRIPASKTLQKIQKTRLAIRRKYFNSYYFADIKSDKMSGKIFRAFIRFTRKFGSFDKKYEKYRKIARKYDNSKSDLISNPEFVMHYEKDMTKYSYYEDLVDHKFEYLTVKVPREYDVILSTLYGDYMKPVKGTQIHNLGTVDTEKPYKRKN